MVDFPSPPLVPGQQYTSGGVTWTWDGVKWTAYPGALPIPDAPNDGQVYGRQFISGAMSWTPAVVGAVTSVAGRVGAVVLSHTDITDWTASLAPYALTTSVPIGSPALPQMDGTAAAGSSGQWADGAHVHPTDTSRAPLASPNLTGTPTAPTATTGDNSTGLANTAFVQASLASYLPLAGGVLSGPLTLAADPGASLQAATKHYVDVSVASGVVTNPNRLINGDMTIAQVYGNSINSVPIAGIYPVDRWAASQTNTGIGNIFSTGVNRHGIAAPGGFPNYFSIGVTAPYTPMAPNAYCMFAQWIEQAAVADLQWGTANALPVTLSFWAYITLPGPYAVTLSNIGRTRSYVATFNPPVGAWTYVTITIPGDQIGTWTNGLSVTFSLGAGINFRTTGNAWAAGMFLTTSLCRDLVSNGSAWLDLTGVKLEAGSAATPFPFRSPADKLQDCQRYQAITYAQGQLPGATGLVSSSLGAYVGPTVDATSQVSAIWKFPVTMRATPTVTLYSPNSGVAGKAYASVAAADLAAGAAGVSDTATVLILSGVSVAAREYVRFHAAASAELAPGF